MNTESVDAYLRDGCGRCEHYQTPQCKVHTWADTLRALRALLRQTELVEEMKWGSPCYTLDGSNVVMIGAFRGFCCLSFLRGCLLADDDRVLEPPGPASRAARVLKFTSVDQLHAQQDLVVRYVQEAIALHRSGARPVLASQPEPMPEELQALLDADADVQAAFDGLTPGRKRSYVLHVGGAKHAATRERRADACIAKILSGKGFNER